MFEKVKLGIKIAGGFGVLILISLVLGGLAIYEMVVVENRSGILAKEYIPEVEIAAELRGAVNRMMYGMRGYGLVGSEAFWNEAQAEMAAVRAAIREGREFEKKAPHLEKLKSEINEADAAFQTYAALVNQTREVNRDIADIRANLDTAAALVTKNVNFFLNSQKRALDRELDQSAMPALIRERTLKINLIYSLIRLVNNVRVANFKSQALQDIGILKTAVETLGGRLDYFEALDKVTRVQADIDALAAVKEATAAYEKEMRHYIRDAAQLAELAQKRDAAGKALIKTAKAIADAGISNTQSIAHEAVSTLETASKILVAGLIAAVVAGLLLAFLVTRSITRPINAVVAGLATGAKQVVSVAEQVANSSQSLADGASRQAASLEETSSSMEEMASMTKQNATNARNADNIIKADGGLVRRTGESAAAMKQVAEDGNRAVTSLADAIAEISQASEETQKIIKTIDEIAFQTNLLALNAAIEAARAGDAGKGFAVVADEVRNLAGRVAEAVEDTTQVIDGSRNKVESVRRSLETVQTSFGEILGAAGDVEKTVAQVSESSGKQLAVVGEISAASEEQAQGVEQITGTITEMDRITQQNAATAEESASAAEELSAQANEMEAFVHNLSSLISGKKNDGNRKEPELKQAVRVTPEVIGETPGKKNKALPMSAEVSPSQVIPFDEDGFKDF